MARPPIVSSSCFCPARTVPQLALVPPDGSTKRGLCPTLDFSHHRGVSDLHEAGLCGCLSTWLTLTDTYMYFHWRCSAQLPNIGHPETLHSFLLCPHLTQSNYRQEGVLVVLVSSLSLYTQPSPLHTNAHSQELVFLSLPGRRRRVSVSTDTPVQGGWGACCGRAEVEQGPGTVAPR